VNEEKQIPAMSFTFVKTDKSKQRYCNHLNILVDEERRIIECNNCGIVLDPFEYLKSTCYQEESAFHKHTQLLLEVDKLSKKYANLNKEIQRLNLIKKQKNGEH